MRATSRENTLYIYRSRSRQQQDKAKAQTLIKTRKKAKTAGYSAQAPKPCNNFAFFLPFINVCPYGYLVAPAPTFYIYIKRFRVSRSHSHILGTFPAISPHAHALFIAENLAFIPKIRTFAITLRGHISWAQSHGSS